MKQKIALLLAGVLVGALVFMLVPAAAHHQPAFKRLKSRVTKLENKVNNRTQLLDSNGLYTGWIFGFQVFGFCDDGAPTNWEDSGLQWADDGSPVIWIDDCFDDEAMAPRRAATERDLQRVLGR